MRVTVFRLVIIVFIILDIGKVPGYDISVWIYVALFLVDVFYIYLKHLIKTLRFIERYEGAIYSAKLSYVAQKAAKNFIKDTKTSK